jgi:hypothetical protein
MSFISTFFSSSGLTNGTAQFSYSRTINGNTSMFQRTVNLGELGNINNVFQEYNENKAKKKKKK